MNDELDQRLTRIEAGIDELRGDMTQHAAQLRRNHGLLVEFIEIVSKAEPDGVQLGPLLEQLVGRISHLVDVSEKSAAAVAMIADRFSNQPAEKSENPTKLKARSG